MPAVFEICVVGCGGGPDETNLSSYLFKPLELDWKDCTLALEAGSGQGALSQIIARMPDLLPSPVDGVNYTAKEMFSFVRAFLVSHAHVDHIASLVLSAGSFSDNLVRRRVYAARQTLLDLETHVFADRIWPNLASWKEDDDLFKLLYTPVTPGGKYKTIFPNVAVRMLPLSHGHNDTHGNYASAAFFVKHESSEAEFLFFGDLEPDSLASKPQTLDVWHAAAPKFPSRLSSIFIECSWKSNRADNLLFGHLNPPHLLAELTVFATEVVRARTGSTRETRSGNKPPRKRTKTNNITPEDLVGSLEGLRVYVTHCKDNQDGIDGKPIHEVIAAEVRELVEASGLGAKIIAVFQGMRIEV